jgi:hypothetical protein
MMTGFGGSDEDPKAKMVFIEGFWENFMESRKFKKEVLSTQTNC